MRRWFLLGMLFTGAAALSCEDKVNIRITSKVVAPDVGTSTTP